MGDTDDRVIEENQAVRTDSCVSGNNIVHVSGIQSSITTITPPVTPPSQGTQIQCGRGALSVSPSPSEHSGREAPESGLDNVPPASVTPKRSADPAKLRDAVESGNYYLVEYLVAMGVNTGVADADGMTPLLLAARHQSVKVLQLLLNKDSVIAQDNKHCNVLHHALRNRQGEAFVPLILEQDFDLNKCNNDKQTPLHYAVRFNKPNALQLLLDKEVDLGRKDHNKLTAADLAIKLRNLIILHKILHAKNFSREMITRDATTKDISDMLQEYLGVSAKPKKAGFGDRLFKGKKKES